MYAVIKTGGKQYRVSPGDRLRVEKLPGDRGSASDECVWPTVAESPDAPPSHTSSRRSPSRRGQPDARGEQRQKTLLVRTPAQVMDRSIHGAHQREYRAVAYRQRDGQRVGEVGVI